MERLLSFPRGSLPPGTSRADGWTILLKMGEIKRSIRPRKNGNYVRFCLNKKKKKNHIRTEKQRGNWVKPKKIKGQSRLFYVKALFNEIQKIVIRLVYYDTSILTNLEEGNKVISIAYGCARLCRDAI
jgi:hypothetical protein